MIPNVAGLMAAIAAVAFGALTDVRVEREVVLMGTRLAVVVDAESSEAGHAAVDRIVDEVSRIEGVLTTWAPDSELARINAAPTGEPVAVSPELFGWLADAWAWARTTNGAFDPALGALVDAWDLRGEGRRPSSERLSAAGARSGRGCFELRPATSTLARECEGAWIDSGGFGKGLALAEAARLVSESGILSARFDFGGQALVIGEPVEVAIAHPAERDTPAVGWPELRGSLATTAQSERRVEVAGEPFGHVLDPRSGLPVEPWGSVSVRSDDAVAADVLSTALFVMGPDRGVRWLAARPDIEAVFLVDAPGGLVACGTARAVGALVIEAEGVARGRDALSPDVISCTPEEEDDS